MRVVSVQTAVGDHVSGVTVFIFIESLEDLFDPLISVSPNYFLSMYFLATEYTIL